MALKCSSTIGNFLHQGDVSQPFFYKTLDFSNTVDEKISEGIHFEKN